MFRLDLNTSIQVVIRNGARMMVETSDVSVIKTRLAPTSFKLGAIRRNSAGPDEPRAVNDAIPRRLGGRTQWTVVRGDKPESIAPLHSTHHAMRGHRCCAAPVLIPSDPTRSGSSSP